MRAAALIWRILPDQMVHLARVRSLLLGRLVLLVHEFILVVFVDVDSPESWGQGVFRHEEEEQQLQSIMRVRERAILGATCSRADASASPLPSAPRAEDTARRECVHLSAGGCGCYLSPSESISTHSCTADKNPDWSGTGIAHHGYAVTQCFRFLWSNYGTCSLYIKAGVCSVLFQSCFNTHTT